MSKESPWRRRRRIANSVDYFQWYGEEAKRGYGDIPASSPDKRLFTLRRPVGVTAAITPLEVCWQWDAPRSSSRPAQRLSPLWRWPRPFARVGLPAGVANVLVGPAGPIVDTLLEDRRVRKLSFTGSTEVGRSPMQKARQDLKRLSLELGGHAPVIVLDDAHLDLAVEGVLAARFRNHGQSCIAADASVSQLEISTAGGTSAKTRTVSAMPALNVYLVRIGSMALRRRTHASMGNISVRGT
ncbi:MAG: aldehyde dehydrogenase family protein [Firmicutes bacterium]|nr:aldehyde dehydrogenase family protein [Bacillota bacterium]